jgi:glutaredoxin-related protein
MIVHYDLNFVGTIERAIKFKQFISLRMILDQIFDEINTNDYNT